MSNLTVDSPTAWPMRSGKAEKEVRTEVAVTPYARPILPLGKVRQLAGLSRRGFEALLGDRQAPGTIQKRICRQISTTHSATHGSWKRLMNDKSEIYPELRSAASI